MQQTRIKRQNLRRHEKKILELHLWTKKIWKSLAKKYNLLHKIFSEYKSRIQIEYGYRIHIRIQNITTWNRLYFSRSASSKFRKYKLFYFLTRRIFPSLISECAIDFKIIFQIFENGILSTQFALQKNQFWENQFVFKSQIED